MFRVVLKATNSGREMWPLGIVGALNGNKGEKESWTSTDHEEDGQ